MKRHWLTVLVALAGAGISYGQSPYSQNPENHVYVYSADVIVGASCGCQPQHEGCLHHFIEWLTYRPLGRPGLAGCCHHCQGCCRPPLYAWFPCQGACASSAGVNGPVINGTGINGNEQPPAPVQARPAAGYSWRPWDWKWWD
jgi:hypothetical protein